MGRYVEVTRLDYEGESEAELTTKTYHGLEIVVNNVTVGRISEYTPPARSRRIFHIRELTPASYGRPIETVPGVTDDGDYKLSIKRAEVWSNELELAFGFEASFKDLTDQNRPFVLEERLFKGRAVYETWVYTGCWFSNLNFDAYSSTGDSYVANNCEITFTSRYKSAG